MQRLGIICLNPSASRPKLRTLSTDGSAAATSGEWVQVSRLGMPLTNEVVIPIGWKDYWNALTPYEELDDTILDAYFYNPELALYMGDDLFGGAVSAFAPLRIQRNSLGAFDFGYGQDGLYGLKGSSAFAARLCRCAGNRQKRPENIDVNGLLAELYFKNGNPSKAGEHLQKALRTGSKNEQWLALRSEIIKNRT